MERQSPGSFCVRYRRHSFWRHPGAASPGRGVVDRPGAASWIAGRSNLRLPSLFGTAGVPANPVRGQLERCLFQVTPTAAGWDATRSRPAAEHRRGGRRRAAASVLAGLQLATVGLERREALAEQLELAVEEAV